MEKAKWEDLKPPYTEMGFNTWEVQCSACGLPQEEPYQICPGCNSVMEGNYPMPPQSLNMSWWEIYYENRRHFKCVNCGTHFTLTFWQWLGTLFHNDIARYRYVKCPYCKERHWLQAKKVV